MTGIIFISIINRKNNGPNTWINVVVVFISLFSNQNFIYSGYKGACNYFDIVCNKCTLQHLLTSATFVLSWLLEKHIRENIFESWESRDFED